MTDLEFMQRPNLWPHLVLPLKQKQGWSKPPKAAILMQAENKQWAFFLGVNIWHMPNPLPDPEIGGEELLKRIVEEGWLVD
jgi:hypothetical protein